MLPRQSSILWGTRRGDAVKIWSLHLASHRLHIQAIIENTLINYLFQRILFFLFFIPCWTTKVKGMFRVLSGSILQLLHLRARGVSWWNTRSLGWADRQNILFATFPGRENIRRPSSEPARHTSRCGWQDGNVGVSEKMGGISPPSAAPHFLPQRVFINLRPWDLGEVAKWKLKHRHLVTQTS